MAITVSSGTAYFIDSNDRDTVIRSVTAAILLAEAYLAEHPTPAEGDHDFPADYLEAALPKRQRYPEVAPVKPLADLFASPGNAIGFRSEMLTLLDGLGR